MNRTSAGSTSCTFCLGTSVKASARGCSSTPCKACEGLFGSTAFSPTRGPWPSMNRMRFAPSSSAMVPAMRKAVPTCCTNWRHRRQAYAAKLSSAPSRYDALRSHTVSGSSQIPQPGSTERLRLLVAVQRTPREIARLRLCAPLSIRLRLAAARTRWSTRRRQRRRLGYLPAMTSPSLKPDRKTLLARVRDSTSPDLKFRSIRLEQPASCSVTPAKRANDGDS